MNITTIGLDIAKNVFQLHGVDVNGKTVLRKQLKPGRVGTCCSCPRGTDATICDGRTAHRNRLKTVGKKTCPPYLTHVF